MPQRNSESPCEWRDIVNGDADDVEHDNADGNVDDKGNLTSLLNLHHICR